LIAGITAYLGWLQLLSVLGCLAGTQLRAQKAESELARAKEQQQRQQSQLQSAKSTKKKRGNSCLKTHARVYWQCITTRQPRGVILC
jgi:predicted lipid-binding transport protein (Tim44 family)